MNVYLSRAVNRSIIYQFSIFIKYSVLMILDVNSHMTSSKVFGISASNKIFQIYVIIQKFEILSSIFAKFIYDFQYGNFMAELLAVKTYHLLMFTVQEIIVQRIHFSLDSLIQVKWNQNIFE